VLRISSPYPFTSKFWLLIAIAVITTCSAIALGRSWKKFFMTPETQTVPRIETELITVYSTGFEPREIKRPAGKFLLDVDNRSELDDLELYLDRQDAGREKSARMRKTAPELRLELDLSPGVYLLREVNHPNWICRIRIIPN